MLDRRHGHHHRDNIKYGYFTLLASVLYIALVWGLKAIYNHRWRKQARPGRRGPLAAIALAPLLVHLVLWLALFLILLFVGIHDFSRHYSALLKRMGRVSFCLIPLDVILAFRPSIYGNASYLEQIPLHKWLLRLIIAGSSVHGMGYLIKWLVEKRFWHQVLRWANFAGVIPMIFALVLVFVSSRPIRTRVYGFFYIWHNLSVLAFVAFIIPHARPGVLDVAIFTLAVLAVQAYLKLSNTHDLPKLSIVDKDELLLRVLKLARPSSYPTEWSAGSHLRLSYRRSLVKFWLLPSHPYTVASLPPDNSITLIVKKTFRFQVYSSLEYTISTPYMSLPPPFFRSAENIHIICGGSGISMGIPLLRYFAMNSSVVCNMTWCIRNRNDAYVLDELTMPNKPVSVYVTGSGSTTLFSADGILEQQHGLLDENESFELHSLNSDNSDDHEDPNPFSDHNASDRKRPGVTFHRGRPKLDEICRPFNDTDDTANKWLIVCGPPSLIQDVKNWGSVHKVHVFSELYDM